MVARNFQPWGADSANSMAKKKKKNPYLIPQSPTKADRGFIPPKAKRPAVQRNALGSNAPGTFRPTNAPQPAARRPGSGGVVPRSKPDPNYFGKLTSNRFQGKVKPEHSSSKPIASSNSRPLVSAKEKRESYDKDALFRRFSKFFGKGR